MIVEEWSEESSRESKLWDECITKSGTSDQDSYYLLPVCFLLLLGVVLSKCKTASVGSSRLSAPQLKRTKKSKQSQKEWTLWELNPRPFTNRHVGTCEANLSDVRERPRRPEAW